MLSDRPLSRFKSRLARRLVKSDGFGRLIRETLASHAYVFGGDWAKVDIAPGAVLNDALLNVSSGQITIGEYAFFGHGVSLLTGTHDISERDLPVRRRFPPVGEISTSGGGMDIK
ncbi:MAG: bacterial transferase hexapeptide family protein [Solirubrobacterales bacterium]|nr:bacterial transferase hexapeptide family protein [Solirubrobacterales bacterium]